MVNGHCALRILRLSGHPTRGQGLLLDNYGLRDRLGVGLVARGQGGGRGAGGQVEGNLVGTGDRGFC